MDEDTESWTLHVDGSSGREGGGAGLILTSPEGDDIEYALRFGFRASNNEAEYEALIAGMKLARALNIEDLVAYSDSQLVVRQLQGEFDAKGERMARYLEMVRAMKEGFRSFRIRHIPREENTVADALSRLASSDPAAYHKGIFTEVLSTPSIVEVAPSVLPVDKESSWIDPIVDLLSTGKLPEDAAEARKLKLKASRYTMIEGQLYKRSLTWPYLKCLRPSEAEYALREVHEGICGQHIGGRTLALKILRQGYYWPTMQAEALEYVRKCEKCQKFSPIAHQPATTLSPISSPLPFAVWGMDILGPFPMATAQRKFVVVAVDYFTKWVEAEPLATISEQNVRNFFWKSIICRFGIPRVLITDNGKQFDNAKFKSFCAELNIQHKKTSVAHPQANGQTEITNRTLLQGIKKRLDQAKGLWAEQLPNVLWAYRTTPRTPTGESPFRLTFGTEAVIPVEVGLPSHRVTHFEEHSNSEGLKADLDFVEEVRERAAIRTAAYQQIVAKYYNSRVRVREFTPGDLALRKAEASDPVHSSGKLSPNWEGPYRVSEVPRPGTYKLETLAGEPIPRTWHAENLRKFYQ